MRVAIATLRRPEGSSRAWLERDEGRLRLVETEGPLDDALVRAFAVLARFDRDRADHRAALDEVLRTTVPAPDGWPRAPLPAALPERTPPRATAAHPRAYRGTIHKPPKAARSRVDVRRYLDRSAALRALGIELTIDPYLAAHHSADGSLDALSPRFRAHVLPLLRGAEWAMVLSLSRRFDLIVRELPDAEPALVHIALGAGRATLAWWDAILARPPAARPTLLDALSALPELSSIDATAVDGALARVEALGEDGLDERARTFVALLGTGASPAYAASGLELSAEHPGPYAGRFTNTVAGQLDAAPLVRRVIAASEPLPDDWERASYAERCWWWLGRLPGVSRALELLCEAPIEPALRHGWVELIGAFAVRPSGAEDWQTCAPLVERAIASGSVRFPRHLRGAFWHVPRIDPSRLERMMRLSDVAGDRTRGTVSILMVLDDGMDAAAVDERALDAIDRATERTPDSERILRGLSALVHEAPDIVERALAAQPSASLRLARALGVMSPERIREVARCAKADPRSEPPASEEAWRAAADRTYRRDPFSRALREHWRGERALTPGQLERHLESARRRWDGARLEIIEQHAKRELSRSLGDAELESEAWEHAIALLAGAERHRRGLARALRAWMRGDHAAIDSHPASRAWLAKHPEVDAERWREGIELTRELTGRLGVVRLAVERDLLEVLRLGTYVGSCLGLGGGFASDAAGVALDVNKRVIYARGADGRVLGRQLLAVSDAGELVCFSVYPTSAPSPVMELFREYDDAFAAYLGLSICTGEYRIANVRSVHLWDDGAWDLVSATEGEQLDE